jgi:GalNAc5-diNAcBac-PP-undecaprenol beta-1,3-glucosyltransferase
MKANYLQILHTVIKTNAYPHFVAAKYSFRDGNGREWPSSMTSIKAGWYGLDTFVKGNMLACNVCVKNANPHLQLFPEERELASMEDWLFLLRNLQTQKIYISDQVGVVMREHEGRSMANNQKIIAARQKATQWALQHLTLNCRHRKLVQAYSAYFCGIHEYIEGNRFASLQH